MIGLETLIELKFVSVSFSSLSSLLKLDKQFPVEQFEATASQSTVPSPPLTTGFYKGGGIFRGGIIMAFIRAESQKSLLQLDIKMGLAPE